MSAVIKILIVEHDHADLELMLRSLKKGGINSTVEVVEREVEFVSALQKFEPDIILSDFSLPRFSGTEAFSLTLSISPRTPFIFVSGTVGEEAAVEMIKSGVTDYVLKDSLYSLPTKINRALKEARLKREKDQAQAELRKNEQTYRLLFESHPSPMWLIDNKTHRFIAVNDEAITQYGYSREEFLSMNALQIRPAADVERFLKTREQNEKASEYRGVWRHMKKDGTEIVVDVNSRLVDLDSKTARLILVNDITENIEAEKSLKALNERMDIISNATHDVIWDWNLIENTCWWNDNFYSLFGYEYDIKIPSIQLWENGIHPADRKAVLESIHHAVESGKKNWASEYRFLKKDGTEVPVFDRGIILHDKKGKPVRMIGSMVDITEREVFKQTLQQSAANLNAIFDNTELGFLLLDISYSVVSCNEPCQAWAIKAFGKPLENKMNLLELMSEQGRPDFANILKLAAVGTALNFETHYTTSDGSTDWYQVMIKPVHRADRSVTGVCLSVNNITKRKEHETEINKLNSELERRVMQRTVELEEANKHLESFSYTVSHDLRAPLRTINGYARIIESEYNSLLNTEALGLFKNIQRSALNMSELIDDLLAFAKLGKRAINKSEVNMKQLIEFVWSTLKETNPNHAELIIGDIPSVIADAPLMRQVFMNLLSNAVKYSSKVNKPVIEASSFVRENAIVYYVKDNGTGFDMKNADRLFGVFQRLHPASEYEGTGIGLANVKRIIDKHDGQVWAKSQPEEGATFYFTLPTD